MGQPRTPPRRLRVGPPPRLRAAFVFAAALTAVVLSAPASAQPESGPVYIWPVDGEIVDPFRLPDSPYGRGNRGIEFATRPGSSFWAAADGVVSFAGPVGGRLHVTVGHPDGLRVSYSGVQSIAVRRGERVRQGQPLGATADRLHVGVRRGETYVDPARVFGGPAAGGPPTLGRPRLVPASPSVYRLQLRWLHSPFGAAVL